MKADVVIGAGYGDEGKGLMTDFLVEQADEPTMVIRFNGGAQAGHTVVRDDCRHVFGHFGSGSLQGAPTYLSKFFVVNPLLYAKEQTELVNKGVAIPEVFIEQDALLTTPYDMLMNQILETARDANRHGSCGVGFGETIERFVRQPESAITAGLLGNYAEVKRRALMARDLVLARLELQLGKQQLNKASEQLMNLLHSEDLLTNFLHNADYVYSFARVCNGWLTSAAAQKMHWVFEGAQGLKLDMDYGQFPYVTRSNTGLQNVAHLLQGIEREVNVHYMTRAYKTRHGAGPLAHEGKPLPKVVDLTNFTNAFQGSLRFAPLDVDKLLSDITCDVLNHGRGLNAKHNLCVTCMDQLNWASVDIVLNNKLITVQHSRMLAELNRMPALNLLCVSNGPAAKDLSYV